MSVMQALLAAGKHGGAEAGRCWQWALAHIAAGCWGPALNFADGCRGPPQYIVLICSCTESCDGFSWTSHMASHSSQPALCPLMAAVLGSFCLPAIEFDQLGHWHDVGEACFFLWPFPGYAWVFGGNCVHVNSSTTASALSLSSNSYLFRSALGDGGYHGCPRAAASSFLIYILSLAKPLMSDPFLKVSF